MDIKYPNLCAPEKCTGCSACYSSCSKNAITMIEDERGELHPSICRDRCVGCGICERICPEINSNVSRHGLPVIYCAWLKDNIMRKNSTSGGAGYAIAAFVLRSGGHVWGATYGDDLSPQYIEINSIKDLYRIQKSKYVQCALGDSFNKIRDELDKEELVLFVGTGCHVKGLLSYLKKSYDNLITVDLICHGVPGQGVFRKYKNHLEQIYNDSLSAIDFRPKAANNGHELGYCSVATFAKRGRVKIKRKKNSYFTGFQRSVFLRNCCYDCQSNGRERFSDITIADFWGLGKLHPFSNWKQRTRGISMIAVNSAKGEKIFNGIKSLLIYENRTIEEACISNSAYEFSAIRPIIYNSFFEDWKTMSWDELTHKYFKNTVKENIMYYIKRYSSAKMLSYVKFKLNWIK